MLESYPCIWKKGMGGLNMWIGFDDLRCKIVQIHALIHAVADRVSILPPSRDTEQLQSLAFLSEEFAIEALRTADLLLAEPVA